MPLRDDLIRDEGYLKCFDLFLNIGQVEANS